MCAEPHQPLVDSTDAAIVRLDYCSNGPHASPGALPGLGRDWTFPALSWEYCIVAAASSSGVGEGLT
ncbi:hypothetical protein VTH06DRAFT_5265 [Thermothelomyces fergusii]